MPRTGRQHLKRSFAKWMHSQSPGPTAGRLAGLERAHNFGYLPDVGVASLMRYLRRRRSEHRGGVFFQAADLPGSLVDERT